jgi:hypothetical protein
MEENQSDTIYPKLRTWIQDAWMKYFIRNGGMVHVKDLAIACKVSDTNMGRYMKGTQLPGPRVQDNIAAILGPGIYAACDAPMRVPKSPFLMDIVVDFHDLTKDEQKEMRDEIRDRAERHCWPSRYNGQQIVRQSRPVKSSGFYNGEK